MTKAERFQFVQDYFIKHAPEAETELVYHNPFQLLVAVILSAQCTDKRVNMTTPALFKRFPNARAMSEGTQQEILDLIKSISYPNSKSKHLHEMAAILHHEHHGKVPLTVEELIKLPGVGRKTANVVTSVVAGLPNMAVDTHVFRVSARLGLTTGAKTPLATEKQLVKHFPKQYITRAHHWLILHGRYVCKARNPLCSSCGLAPACKYFAKSAGAGRDK